MCTKTFGIKPIKILDQTEYFRRKFYSGFHNSQIYQNPEHLNKPYLSVIHYDIHKSPNSPFTTNLFYKAQRSESYLQPAKFWWLSLIHLSQWRLWEACPLVVKPCCPNRRKAPGWANGDWNSQRAVQEERETDDQPAAFHIRLWDLDYRSSKFLTLSITSCKTFNKLLNLSNFGFLISKMRIRMMAIKIILLYD